MELARPVFLSLLWIFVWADHRYVFSSYEHEDGKYAEKSFGSLLTKCDKSKGVCIQVGACPWNRMLPDRAERCLEVHPDYVCCKVAQVRMPVDMFEAYGM